MSVTFKSEQSKFIVSHEHLFHCGAILLPHKVNSREPDYEAAREQGIPAPEKFGTGYIFIEGEDHNLLTLDTDEEIEAMRAYAATTDNRVVELDENGNDPVENIEGTVFEADTPHFRLTPAVYKGITSAEGKTFAFNVGAKRNQYVTEDAEEIVTLRAYISQNMNTGIKEA